MPLRKPDLLSIDKAAKLIGRNQATIFRWFRQGLLTRHYMHDFEAGVRRAAVDMHELREKMPRLLAGKVQARARGTSSAPAPDPAPSPQQARTDDGRPVLAGAIIPHPDGRAAILMSMHVWHAESAWSWIGGHVRPGEDPVDAVLREIHEELEIQGARVVRLLGVVDTHEDTSRWWGPRYVHGHVGYHYLVAIEAADVRVVDHEELSRVEWLTLDQVAAAVAELPEEVREADLRFAREAVGLPAAAE
jgi:ADP-ribose pyrophosphatase YjhB (NUDIX family)